LFSKSNLFDFPLRYPPHGWNLKVVRLLLKDL
jgi:hypothetical protein